MTAEARTWKEASSELRVMLVSSTALPVVGERGAGTVGSRYGDFRHEHVISPIEHRLERPSCVLPSTISHLQFTFLFPYVRIHRYFLTGFIFEAVMIDSRKGSRCA